MCILKRCVDVDDVSLYFVVVWSRDWKSSDAGVLDVFYVF